MRLLRVWAVCVWCRSVQLVCEADLDAHLPHGRVLAVVPVVLGAGGLMKDGLACGRLTLPNHDELAVQRQSSKGRALWCSTVPIPSCIRGRTRLLLAAVRSRDALGRLFSRARAGSVHTRSSLVWFAGLRRWRACWEEARSLLCYRSRARTWVGRRDLGGTRPPLPLQPKASSRDPVSHR